MFSRTKYCALHQWEILNGEIAVIKGKCFQFVSPYRDLSVVESALTSKVKQFYLVLLSVWLHLETPLHAL